MAKQTKALAPTPESVEELTLAVQALTDQVRMLRQAVDEIGDELGWAIRKRVIPELLPPPSPSRACRSIHWPTISASG